MKYDKEQTKLLLELYANGEGSSVAEIALHMQQPERSVIAKLSSLGVYKKQPYLNKRGELPIKKEEYVEKIAALLGKDVSLLDSLEKTNKAVLHYIVEALEECSLRKE